ncbi:MAG: TIGR01906 family membrane protein [Clostridium sp.]|uniref:TIGR01906 family membrane protein n=1 Tax=Clostridium sp. TaxID=1506 RepID=UPI002FCA3748
MRKTILCSTITIIGIILIILIATISVTKFKPIYNFSVNIFDIDSNANLPKEKILDNYSYIVDYILNDEAMFELPSLPFSEDGAIHFQEVKELFNLCKKVILILISTLIILLIVYINKYRDFMCLKYTGLGLIMTPVVGGIMVSLNFNYFFTVFHKIFFNNNKWIFDPQTDPIINILPEEFFALCGGVILFFCILTGLFMYIAHNKYIKYQLKTT